VACHHGAVSIRWLLFVAYWGAVALAVIGALVGLTTLTAVGGAVAVLALMTLIGYGQSTPRAVRWILLAAVFALAMAVIASDLLIREPPAGSVWFAYSPTTETKAQLASFLTRMHERQLWASIGMLLAIVLLGAAMILLPRKRRPFVAVLIVVAGLALSRAASSFHPADVAHAYPARLHLAGAIIAIAVAALASQLSGFGAALAVPGALLLVALSAADAFAVIETQSWTLTPPGNVPAPVLAGEVTTTPSAIDVAQAMLIVLALVGVGLVTLGCHSAARRSSEPG
jgi:hypothetical protein